MTHGTLHECSPWKEAHAHCSSTQDLQPSLHCARTYSQLSMHTEHSAVQGSVGSAGQCRTVQGSAGQHRAVQCRTVHAVVFSAIQSSVVPLVYSNNKAHKKAPSQECHSYCTQVTAGRKAGPWGAQWCTTLLPLMGYGNTIHRYVPYPWVVSLFTVQL